MPNPPTKQDLLSLLGLARYFRNWIPSFGILAKPLYEAIKRPLQEPLLPGKSVERPFQELKEAFTNASPLALPDFNKPFILYTDERQDIAVGLLGQKSGPDLRIYPNN